MKESLTAYFIKEYGEKHDKILVFAAPGRVNLIGEHIDYNGGMVFPAALDLNIYMAIGLRKDRLVSFKSLNFQGNTTLSLDHDLVFNEEYRWANYPIGVIKVLIDKGYKIDRGFDALFISEIPLGAGLSSSAALEVVFGYGINYLFNLGINEIDLALLCQKAENNFIGVKCGIMDQFTVTLGRKNKGIILDCDTLKYKYIPLNLGEYKLVITNSNKKRSLIESKYNERLKECREALNDIRKYEDIQNLCSIPYDALDRFMEYVISPVAKKRLKHVVTENKRVEMAAIALKDQNLPLFGDLMKESHISLKDDYEVSGFELDTIFDIASNFKGCIGTRMTGAGFGGCNISLVRQDLIEDFKHEVYQKYMEQTGIIPEFYVSEIGDGVKRIV